MTQELAARASTIPAPIVIPASQNFEGNDGPVRDLGASIPPRKQS